PPPRWARPRPQARPRSAAPWASASRRSAAPPPVSRRSIRAAAPTAAAALASPCARRPLPRTVSSQPSPSRTPWSASPPWGGVASHAARARPDTPSPAMVTPGSPPLARRCNPPASLRTTAMVRRAAPALPRTRRHSNPCVRWRPPPAPPSPRAPPRVADLTRDLRGRDVLMVADTAWDGGPLSQDLHAPYGVAVLPPVTASPTRRAACATVPLAPYAQPIWGHVAAVSTTLTDCDGP